MQVDKLRNLIKHTKNLNILYVKDNLEVQTQTAKMLQSFFNNQFVPNEDFTNPLKFNKIYAVGQKTKKGKKKKNKKKKKV